MTPTIAVAYIDSWDGSKVNATYSISGTSLTLHPQGEDSVTLQRSN